MTQMFDKLVRDNLPEILRKDGMVVDFYCGTPLDNDMTSKYATRKLIEEATEVALATTKAEILVELGDLYEVMLKVAKCNGIEPHEIIHAASDKAKKYGTFNNNVILKEIVYK